MDKTTQERINADAEAYANKNPNALTKSISYQSYIAGATAENEKTEQAIEAAIHKERNAIQAKITAMEVRHLKQIHKLLDVLQKIVHAPVPANEREYMSWFVTAKNVAGGAISTYEAENEVRQWNGTGKDQFTGSTFTSPAPGITLGCISPEARELLDTIMEQWEAHYKTVKTDTYEPTFYGFAYWLVRWSGLITTAPADKK